MFTSGGLLRTPSILLLALAALALTACGAFADEIELTSGKKYQGQVIERGTDYVIFRVVLSGGGKMQMQFPARQVKSVRVDGKAPVTPPPAPEPKSSETPETAPPPSASPSPGGEVGAAQPPAALDVPGQILQAGRTPPDWWDSVPLNYPDTLDLAGTNRIKGWKPDHNLGAHLWSHINPNPDRWQQGIRLLHHVVEVRKNDPERLREAMEMLARSYQELLRDYARAAFWWESALERTSRPNLRSVISLAECYWNLGSKPMAQALLKRYRVDRMASSATVKLFGDMGETRWAEQLAQTLIRSRPVEGHLALGNLLRQQGRTKDALEQYRLVLQSPADRRSQRHRQRAQAALSALERAEGVDLSRVPDGVHRGSASGYRGPVEVEVTVREGRIEAVRVVRHKEDRFLTALIDVPQHILEKQGVDRIDAVTGATISSEAVLNAAAAALADAAK
jgi:uncharacterized protein with FMN-binding domain